MEARKVSVQLEFEIRECEYVSIFKDLKTMVPEGESKNLNGAKIPLLSYNTHT